MRCRAGNRMTTPLVIALTVGSLMAADGDIRLTGCLVRAEHGDGYLVTNLPGEAAWQRAADATAVPGPVGTSGTVASILYWLENRDGIDDHVGQYVEIDGMLQGDLKDGQITVTPKEDWTEVGIVSGGRAMKVRMPRSVLITAEEGGRTLDILVRRVVPQRIRMLAAGCGR
jgi:hypothetical protein